MAFNWSGAIDGSYKQAQSNPKNWMDNKNSGSVGGANPEQPEQDVLDEKYQRKTGNPGGIGTAKGGGYKNMQATHNNLSSRQMGREVGLKTKTKATGKFLNKLQADDERTGGRQGKGAALSGRAQTAREKRLSAENANQNTGTNAQAETAKKRRGRGL